MPVCNFCHQENPTGVDRCPKCGSWLEQAIPPATSPQPAADAADVAPDSLEGQVLALMRAQRAIEAIKLYREQTGVGLKEAKDAVESLAIKHDIGPKGAGCAGMVLLVFMVLVVLGAWV